MEETMNGIQNEKVHVTTDVDAGVVVATVELAASPERVFRALASKEIVDWWVRPGVFDTTEWSGDVRAGGRWRASGTGNGRPYTLEGEFLAVDAPRRLVHTWQIAGAPAAPTTLTYLVERSERGSRVTLRHEGFTSAAVCTNTGIGWETSFEALAERLASEPHTT
jgi:uncharacterized protein YndB with AHSA1/START domain